MRHFTDRNEPKNIGNKAMIIKLEYAVTSPCGVAAALPVAFFAVSLTVAVIFAIVSFTTLSAMLVNSVFFCLSQWLNRPTMHRALAPAFSNEQKPRVLTIRFFLKAFLKNVLLLRKQFPCFSF